MRVRVCPKCGKHNSESIWSCIDCGETLSMHTFVDLDNEAGVPVAQSLSSNVENLLQNLQSRNISVRETAIEKIGRLNITDKRVIIALKNAAVLDSDKHIREAATEILYTLGYELSRTERQVIAESNHVKQEKAKYGYGSPVIEERFIHCIQCGTKLPQDAKFCYKCGSSTVRGGTGDVETRASSSTTKQKEKIRPKTKPVCAMPGCNYDANRRCTDCGKTYCVEHIGYSHMCDSCTVKSERESEIFTQKEQASRRNRLIVYFSIMIGGIVLCYFGSQADNWLLGVIGILVALLGFGLLREDDE